MIVTSLPSNPLITIVANAYIFLAFGPHPAVLIIIPGSIFKNYSLRPEWWHKQ